MTPGHGVKRSARVSSLWMFPLYLLWQRPLEVMMVRWMAFLMPQVERNASRRAIIRSSSTGYHGCSLLLSPRQKNRLLGWQNERKLSCAAKSRSLKQRLGRQSLRLFIQHALADVGTQGGECNTNVLRSVLPRFRALLLASYVHLA